MERSQGEGRRRPHGGEGVSLGPCRWLHFGVKEGIVEDDARDPGGDEGANEEVEDASGDSLFSGLLPPLSLLF